MTNGRNMFGWRNGQFFALLTISSVTVWDLQYDVAFGDALQYISVPQILVFVTSILLFLMISIYS